MPIMRSRSAGESSTHFAYADYAALPSADRPKEKSAR